MAVARRACPDGRGWSDDARHTQCERLRAACHHAVPSSWHDVRRCIVLGTCSVFGQRTELPFSQTACTAARSRSA
ncbi:MAG: hypothetical protein ACK559_29525, partial [bacterium]